ncbi:MAG: PAS domain-containing sensor histidine kinase [Acidobacteriota bacterium]
MMTNEGQTETLIHAFRSFTEVSNSLQGAFFSLQEQVGQLSEQLEHKNYYLNCLLQSLPCGVIVLDSERRVTTINKQARRLFECEDMATPFPLHCLLINASFSDRAQLLMEQDVGDITEIALAGSTPKTLHCAWSNMRDGERILVVQDMTKIRQLEKQMQDAQRVAAMGEMALEVAHEIRNPLGALELFASLLSEDGISEQERQLYLRNIQVGIRSLNTVLTNMLCYRRCPAVHWESLQVGAVMREVASLMAPLFQQREIAVELDFTDQTDVMLDRQMVRQIFINLVSNSLQALPEGGRLTLRSSQTETEVRAEVIDTGIGIPRELQKLVFTAGFTTGNRGSGLGLAIVQRFVEVLGGSIQVDSGEQCGTKFTLVFPVEKRAHEADPGR